MNFRAKWPKTRFLKKLQSLIVQFWVKMCQKKRNKCGYDILKSFYQNDQFFGNGRLLEIKLLQCYVVVFWIHVIDAICTKTKRGT